jgi:nucleoid-associated protein YgaU
MGKVEKLVVLSVLFIISVILVVSLSTGGSPNEVLAKGDGERAQKSTELDAGTDAERSRTPDPITEPVTGGPASNADEAPIVQGDAERNVLTLTSEVDPAGRADLPAAVIPAGWNLTTLAGLRDTFDPELKLFVCTEGDTFNSVAAKFYGDAGKAGLLQRNNEGLTALATGQEIWVPVRDDLGFSGNSYIVQDGESLWIISKKVYGKGSRWGELFEENRDVLKSSDALKVGMTLRIP